MDTPQAPPAPDPVLTAKAQGAENKAAAQASFGMNAVNQVTPQGTLTYTQNGTWSDGTPRFTATTALSPDQQRLSDINTQNQLGIARTGNSMIDRVSGALSSPVDFGPNLDLGPRLNLGQRLDLGPGLNLGSGPDLGGPLKLDTNATEARTMELARQRLDPMLQNRIDAKKAELFNSGAMPGTEAYARGMDEVQRANNDAMTQMILGGHDQAVRDLTSEYQAGQEQKKYGYEAGQARTQAEYAADQARRQAEFGAGQQQTTAEYNADQQARQAEYAARETQTAAQRNQIFNEIASILSGSQIQMPNFVNTPQSQVAPADIIGAQQQNLNQQNVGYNAQVASNNAMMGGLFGLGGAIGGAAMGGWGGGGGLMGSKKPWFMGA